MMTDDDHDCPTACAQVLMGRIQAAFYFSNSSNTCGPLHLGLTAGRHALQRAGRKLAPFLRVLLPAWWLARFDLHADTAASAQAAMQAAFAGPKQREAILFCRAEVANRRRARVPLCSAVLAVVIQ